MLGEGGRGYLGYALRMKVCVYILSSVKGVAYTILLQAQIKKFVLSGKFEV